MKMKIKKYIKNIYLLICLSFALLPIYYIKADNDLTISKELTKDEIQHVNWRIKFLWDTPWKLWDNYHKAHKDLNFRERRAWGILDVLYSSCMHDINIWSVYSKVEKLLLLQSKMQ